jgi:hypothetical protein
MESRRKMIKEEDGYPTEFKETNQSSHDISVPNHLLQASFFFFFFHRVKYITDIRQASCETPVEKWKASI